jgi:cell wall-associated NlpC family hydrolase
VKSRVIPGASAIGLTLAAVLWSGVPAVADPVDEPSWDEINAAANDPTQRDALVNRVQAALDDLESKYEQAASARDDARTQSASVQQQLTDAIGSFLDLQQQVNDAQTQADASKKRAGQVAAQLSRGGGSATSAQLASVAGVESADEALSRLSSLGKLGGDLGAQVDAAIADANTLTSLRDQMQQQQDALQQLADEYDQRTQDAESKVQQAYDLFTSQTDEVVQLKAQLAQLQGGDVEQAKQQAQTERTQQAKQIAPVSAGNEADDQTGAVPAVQQAAPTVVATPSTSSSKPASNSSQSSSSSSASKPAASTSKPASNSSSSSSSNSSSSASTGSRGAAIVAYARQFIGTPYVWGGTTPAGFDCSGFTSYVYVHNGISLPRVSQSQMNVGYAVSDSAAQPGDLVWMSGGGHVGIYIGGGLVIHSPKPGDVVKITPLSVWSSHGVRRVF